MMSVLLIALVAALVSVRRRQQRPTDSSSLFGRVIHAFGDSACDDHTLDGTQIGLRHWQA
jgi:hypothetical protein